MRHLDQFHVVVVVAHHHEAGLHGRRAAVVRDVEPHDGLDAVVAFGQRGLQHAGRVRVHVQVRRFRRQREPVASGRPVFRGARTAPRPAPVQLRAAERVRPQRARAGPAPAPGPARAGAWTLL
ncbi:MAG: hypothetical protein JF619_27730 [Massilia sp.]|nr:hypothetical protein [Massilia sp.]